MKVFADELIGWVRNYLYGLDQPIQGLFGTSFVCLDFLDHCKHRNKLGQPRNNLDRVAGHWNPFITHVCHAHIVELGPRGTNHPSAFGTIYFMRLADTEPSLRCLQTTWPGLLVTKTLKN